MEDQQVRLLQAIAQGDAVDERTGREILMKSLQIKQWWRTNASSSNGVGIKCWLMCHKNADGALPAYTDIWKDPTDVSSRVIALRNTLNLEDFVVIKSWTVNLGISDGGKSVQTKEMVIPLNIHCKYHGSSDETRRS